MGAYNRKDHFYQKAKAEGYRSRAAYKLIELDEKYGLFKSGMKVLDLGCAPGGWLQIAAQKVGSSGLVVGVDLAYVPQLSDTELKKAGISNAPILIVGDLLDEDIQKRVIDEAGGRVNLIISDMSPDISGIRFQDAVRSAELVEVAFEIAKACLIDGGNLVAKVFPGNEADEVYKAMSRNFKKVSRIGLSSTRKTSKEYYFVAMGFFR